MLGSRKDCMFKRDTNSGSDNDTAPLMSSRKGAGASEDPFYAVREYVSLSSVSYDSNP